MFERFPKIRNPLPKEYQEIYEQFYKSNRNGETTASGLAQKLERWLHKKIAKDTKGTQGRKTLEIGAGTLNQLKFESDFSHYDVIEPFSSLYADSPNLSKVHRIYNDITEVASEYGVLKEPIRGGDTYLSQPNQTDSNPSTNSILANPALYDRIISSAVLEHILDLPLVVAYSCLLLADDGVFSASIPSQGRCLWTLGYKATTGFEFHHKYGLNYDVIMNYEHINTQQEIIEVCQYFFDDIKKSLFGISNELSLYTHLSCRKPNTQKARNYIASQNTSKIE